VKNQTILTALAVLAAALAHPAMAEFTRHGGQAHAKGEVTHLNGIALPPITTTFVQPVLANWTYDKSGEPTHYKGIPIPPMQTVEEARAATDKRLAAIKAEEAKQAAEAAELAIRDPQPATAWQELFFTGKPYLEETGQYLFLFRHYDPELARWTTADPSGFPDGANNVAYMAVPTSGLDFLGLETLLSGDLARVQAAIEGFRSLGWTAAVRRAELSLANGEDEVAPQTEINALFSAEAFSNIINNDYFARLFVANGKTAFDYSGAYPLINYGVTSGIPTNDLAAAYGNMGGMASGSFSRRDEGNRIHWSIDVEFSFADAYDFGGQDYTSSAFRRLQQNGLASIYATSGKYSQNFSGVVE
jgi:RHS repeat-associated protein